MKFSSLDALRRYYQKQLDNRNFSAFKDIKSLDGKSFSVISDDVLIGEAEELRVCVQKRIDEYYSSYTPKRYRRTYGLKNALRAETTVREENGVRYIGLYFLDSKSWGKSVFTGEWTGWKPGLISDGWEIKKDIYWGKTNIRFIHRFGYYEGSKFIEKGIEDWKNKSGNSKYIEVRRKEEI
jgi:hypothetical protein